MAGREDDRVLSPEPVGELALELDVQVDRAVEEARAGQARAVAVERVACALLDALVAGQPQVVVGAEHDPALALHLHDRQRRPLQHVEVRKGADLAGGLELFDALELASLGENVDCGHLRNRIVTSRRGLSTCRGGAQRASPGPTELYEIEVLDGELVEQSWTLAHPAVAERIADLGLAAACRPRSPPRPGSSPAPPRWRCCAATGCRRLERSSRPSGDEPLPAGRGRHLHRSRAAAAAARRVTHAEPALSQPEPALSTEVRVEVRPPWPFRLTRRSGMDGLSPVRRGVLHRLLHACDDAQGHEQPVHVRVAQLSSGSVLIGARAADRGLAERAIARMRRALGVDLDLRAFHDEFRRDPLIGAAVRANPALRPPGRPDPFEALAWAVTEQLIEYERAAAIQRRMVAALGRRDPESGLRNSPSAAVFAGAAPARLESFDLSGGRARRARQGRARGRRRTRRARRPDPGVQEAGWRRLRAIPGIGSWTVEILALTGQGRLDQIPAGDLGLIKLVGRCSPAATRWARAEEQQVRDFFARFGRWQGLAASYALRAAGSISPLSQ